MRPLGKPPHQRPNWTSLNRGQKLYAIRQYNLALSRRGLPLLPYDTLTGLQPRYIPDSSENGEADSPGAVSSPDTVDTDNFLDGEEYTSDNVFEECDMADVASTSAKRGPQDADSSGGSKRTKTAETSGMALPGTGNTADGDPDTGNPSPENAVISRPINNFSGYKLVFRKHHTLLSYGLAWKISRLSATSNTYFTTTSLMSVPVELPFFYLSPAEWNWVKEIRGVKVDVVRCRIVMRNPRTAFETNASTTTLATLNQNKFLATAIGLTSKTRGLDRTMVFGTSSDTMIPNSTKPYNTDEKNKFVVSAYGSSEKTPKFTEGFANVPCSFNYLPMINNRYFCSVAQNNSLNKDIGWPDLSQYIKKEDASFMTGKTVIDYEYKPVFGLLGQPFQMRLNGHFGDDDDVHQSGKRFKKNKLALMSRDTNNLQQIYNVDVESGTMSAKSGDIIDVEKDQWENIVDPSGYYLPIEKSQYVWQKPETRGHGKIQPSVHVGIYPVPRLTTTDLQNTPVKFTDVEMQWDVDCEMHLSYGFSDMNLSHYDKPFLVPFEDAVFTQNIPQSKDLYFQSQYSTVQGEYVTRIKETT